MKAKEYIAQIEADLVAGATAAEAIGKAVSGLSNEAVDLARQRAGGGTPSGIVLEACLKEIELRWRAIANHYNGMLNPNGFREYWADKGIHW